MIMFFSTIFKLLNFFGMVTKRFSDLQHGEINGEINLSIMFKIQNIVLSPNAKIKYKSININS